LFCSEATVTWRKTELELLLNSSLNFFEKLKIYSQRVECPLVKKEEKLDFFLVKTY